MSGQNDASKWVAGLDERASAIDLVKMAALGYPDVTFAALGPASMTPLDGLPETYAVRQELGRIVYRHNHATGKYESVVKWAAVSTGSEE